MKKRFPIIFMALLVVLLSIPTSATESEEDVLPKTLTPAFTYGSAELNGSAASGFASVILLEPVSGNVIYAKNQAAPFALGSSCAQLMNAQLAIQLFGLSHRIKVSAEMLRSDYEYTIGLVAGDKPRVCELIAAMFLCGAQDAAAVLSYAIADASGGGAADKLLMTTALMNNEALRLGMNGTTYSNALGSFGAGQVSSAEDTARLMYALYMSGEAGRLVMNTDYLLGCLARAGYTQSFHEADPRNPQSSDYDVSVSGCTFRFDNGLCISALAKDVQWQTSSSTQPTLDSELFCVTISTAAHSAEMLSLMNQAAQGYSVLYYRGLCEYLMQNTQCAYCDGTVKEHRQGCAIDAQGLGLDSDSRARMVANTTFTLMTEMYKNNALGKFSLAYAEEPSATAAEVGKKATSVTVYFEDEPFITEDLYTEALFEGNEGEDLTFIPPANESNENGFELKWQVVIIFALGIPLVVIALLLTIIRRQRIKKL